MRIELEVKVKVGIHGDAAMSTKPPGGCPTDVQGVGPGSAFQGLTGRGGAEAGGGGILSSKPPIAGGKLAARAAPVGEDKMTCQPAPLRCQGGWVPALQLGLPYPGGVLVLLFIRHKCYCNCEALTYGFVAPAWAGWARSEVSNPCRASVVAVMQAHLWSCGRHST